MKLSRKTLLTVRLNARALQAAALVIGVAGVSIAGWQARAALPQWMQDAVAASAIEAALYRAMDLPQVKAMYPRPPKEAQAEIGGLIGKAPQEADLYSLRAMEEEQALDFQAAEADWKAYAAKASDKVAPRLELADYYHRRLQTTDEVRELMNVAVAPAQPGDQYVAPSDQRSWKTFERLLGVIQDQRLDSAVTRKVYAAWILRYPTESSLYAREFQWLLKEKDFDVAAQLLSEYKHVFPEDRVFPAKAAALLEYRRGGAGSVDRALAVYDAGFQPLWPAELIESYYALLAETHHQRKFVSDARARLAQNPDDLSAMARLFYYAQQQGNLAAALDIVESYRLSKESRSASWSAQELYTMAQLTEAVHSYPEAARYNFALYHAQGKISSRLTPQAEGLSGMVRILLAAPEEPIALGAQNLSMYRDIATLDRGPGYWNGILSLWLNSSDVRQSYSDEDSKAQPYFHRGKAAELLAVLDKQEPSAPTRAELHKEMIRVFAEYGQSGAVIKEGNDFLANFNAPGDEPNRVAVAMLMADAYARRQDLKDEFALYDRLLTELSAKTAGMPLTAAAASNRGPATVSSTASETQTTDGTDQAAPKVDHSRAFEVSTTESTGVSIAGAQEYQLLLERYLGRLTAEGQLPQALSVLRKELDRNPNDPLLYERLATFLQQNNLSAQEEEVYQQAIQKFQDKSWYDKLARLYIREKKREAFADLTKQVTNIFHGTELEGYFAQVNGSGAQMFLQLNLYAHERFPHDRLFVSNLLRAYSNRPTRDLAAWETLLRQHWWESEGLRMEFFDYLNRTGKLDEELNALKAILIDAKAKKNNPAATSELAEVEIWRSHFEQSAPLLASVADEYPANAEVGEEAASVFRSLAYFDSASTQHAVAIEKRLLAADPADTTRMEKIGDIYSDSGAAGVAGHENIAAAAPYWRRMPAVHPGSPDGYLQAATVFWDYFQFDDALEEIREARKHFGPTTLYGYEAGAIYEGKRDFPSAIHEYTLAAVDGNSEASGRLLQLAHRKAWQKIVDQETASAAASNSSVAALQLREQFLQIQKRENEIAPLLDAALSKASTFDELQAIGTQAQNRGLPAIYEHALQRQIEMASDPVQKIQLSYELSRSYEGRKDAENANRTIEAIYRENPKIIGVVRTTTDYYWRTHQQVKGIEILVDASKAAQPSLGRQFVVEAADKANDSGEYNEARTLMQPLLDASAGGDAFNAQYIAVVANSYARAGDDAGLKAFYLSKLDAIRSVPAKDMTSDERKQNTVLLRRGLIPALTRMKDYAGATDQYIEILSAYPEDPGTIDEAALYALRYEKQEQLTNFVLKTVKASPRDSRFDAMLAQIQTTFEQYPEAIDAYAHAIAIRADRSDWYQAKADLEERLQRLDDACADYERLYLLSYQNADWMVRIAAVRARQGRRDDAVKALERAWIDGHPPMASSYFRVAAQLETWNILDESLRFAELGVKTEGSDLLGGVMPGSTNGDDAGGVVLYAGLMTRLHQQDKLLATLDSAREAANVSSDSPSVVMAQVEKQGIASVTDEEWRIRRAEMRRDTATQRYRSAIVEMGKTVGTYFTPEEKAQFAQLVKARWSHDQQSDPREDSVWIAVASDAGLRDVEAGMRRELLLSGIDKSRIGANSQFGLFVSLERSRMQYTDLAKTMEEYALRLRPEQREPAYAEAANAYRDAGDETSELRILTEIGYSANADTGRIERTLQLLLKHNKRDFEVYASGSKDDAIAMAAPNYAIAHGDGMTTRAALEAHAKQFDPVWENAYSSLTGLYFRDSSAVTRSAFVSVLGDATIGERVKMRVDRSQQLAGNDWFYYGMRYGVLRTLVPEKEWPNADPEDFLSSELERNPAAAAGYAELAEAYVDAGKTDAALIEYRHALELTKDSAAIHDAMALLLWKARRKDEAIAEWRNALTTLERVEDKGPAPESFWSDFRTIAQHLGERKLTQPLHGELDSVLRTYIVRNGNYRSVELLEAVYLASATASEGDDWIFSLSAAAHDEASILTDLEGVSWLPGPAHERVLIREIELARVATAKTAPEDTFTAERLAQLQKLLALYYVAQLEDGKAETIIQAMTDEQRKDGDIVVAQIELLARSRNSTATIPQYLRTLEENRNNQYLRNAAAKLSDHGDLPNALVILEFVFDQGQKNHDLMASDYLGLAAARIDAGNVQGGLELLRRMALLNGDVFANTELAAALLEKKQHPSEAIEFLSTLVKGVPWDASYAVRLARAQLKAEQNTAQAEDALRAVAASNINSYDLRTDAAKSIHASTAQRVSLGSAELDLLAGSQISARQAQQPYFVAARISAAKAVRSASEQSALLRQVVAITASTSGMGDFGIRLLKAEVGAGHYATASVILESLVNGSNPSSDDNYAFSTGSGSESESSNVAPDPEVNPGAVETDAALARNAPLPSQTGGTRAAKLDMALLIASIYEKNDEAQSALPYLKLAAHLQTDASLHSELAAKVQFISRTLWLRARNKERAPIIQKALEQSVVVRPMLTEVFAEREVTQ